MKETQPTRLASRASRLPKILPIIIVSLGVSAVMSLAGQSGGPSPGAEAWLRYDLQGSTVDIPRVSMQQIEVAKPKVDADARVILDEVQSAYKNLKSVDISGNFSVGVKTTNGTHGVNQPFTSSFEQPNKFRHQLKPDILVGCDGKSGYVFDEKQNAYLRFSFPPARQAAQTLPMGLLSTLLLQNPSLLFALTDSSVEDLLRSFGNVSRIADSIIDGVKYPVLQFGASDDPNRVRLFVDPKTHLIRRFVLDLKSGSPAAEPSPSPGESAVTAGDAAVTVDYTAITPRDGADPARFAWVPPAGATDVLEAAGAEPHDMPSVPLKEPSTNGGTKF